MTKLYLLIFASDAGEGKSLARETVTAWLDNQQWSKVWFYSMPGSIFIKSDLNPKEMSEKFEAEFGDRRHFFVDITARPHWGRMPQDHWGLLK